MEEDGFTLVATHKRSRRQPVKPSVRLLASQDIFGPLDLEHGLKTLLSAKDEMSSTEFWSSLRSSLDSLSSQEKITCLYCFGLGHPTSSVSRHQTALLLLLKEELNIPTAKTLVYDPVLSAEENCLLAKLGFQPQTENSECKVSLGERTLVYMPHCSKQLTNNILYANWSPQGLRKLVLVSNSLSSVTLRTPRRDAERSAHLIARVVDHNIHTEIRLPDSVRYSDVFNDTAVQTFTVGDLTALPDSFWTVDQPVYDPDDLEYIAR